MDRGEAGGDEAGPGPVEGPAGPADCGHPQCTDEGSEHLVGCHAGEAQHRGEAQNQHPERGMAGGGLHVPDGQCRVGTGRDARRVGDEQQLLGTTVQVPVGLGEAQAVGQQVRRLVVVDPVTREWVSPLHQQDVGHPQGESQEEDQGEAAPEVGIAPCRRLLVGPRSAGRHRQAPSASAVRSSSW